MSHSEARRFLQSSEESGVDHICTTGTSSSVTDEHQAQAVRARSLVPLVSARDFRDDAVNESATLREVSGPSIPPPMSAHHLGSFIAFPSSSHARWTLPKFKRLTSSRIASNLGYGNRKTRRNRACWFSCIEMGLLISSSNGSHLRRKYSGS